MKRLDAVLDYALWPGLMLAAVVGMAWGMAHGRGPLVFNGVYLVLAATLYGLEKVRPHEIEWSKSDGQETADVAHTLFTKVAVQVTVVALTNFGLTQQFGERASGGIWPDGWPLWAQVAAGLVAAEFGLYWAHRFAHEWSWLWPFHAVHHSSTKLWFLNTGRFHFVDTLKSMVCATPIPLLAGASGDVIIWVSAITAFIGILTHCNVRMRFGWLNYVFNTPGLHRWHHSMDLREGNRNYGENLVLWDQLFGTYFDDTRRRPPADIGIREAMPPTFLEQLRAPFVWQRYQRGRNGSTLQDAAGRSTETDGERPERTG